MIGEKAQELCELAAAAGIENARERLEAPKSNSPPTRGRLEKKGAA
jgi:hypothetical protein